MRIIQISSFYPPKTGGMQNSVKEISEHLASIGHSVDVYTTDIECDYKYKSTKCLRIHYLKGFVFANIAFIPSLFFKLLKIPKNSVMHVHTPRPFASEIVMIVSKLRNIPYVVHVHGDVKASSGFGIFLPLYKKYVYKKVLQNASKVICLSEAYRKFISNTYQVGNIVVIQNGVNDRFFLKKSDNHDATINLLYIGRLSKEKNLEILIKTASLIKYPVILNIVGDGYMKNRLQNLATKSNVKNVIFHGKKNSEDILQYYKFADIFLLASSYEGLPLVLLEAMASSTPIVASDVLGIHDLLEGHGILVNPPTIDNFHKSIEYLIENKKLRKNLAIKGVEYAKKFKWSLVIKNLEDVYTDVTNSNNGAFKNIK